MKAKSRLSAELFRFKAEMPDVDVRNTTRPSSPAQDCSLLDTIVSILLQVPHVSKNLAGEECEKETYKLTKNGYKVKDDEWLRPMAYLRGGFFVTGVVPKYPGTND